MKIWLPAIRSGTGVDVFTERLAEALRAREVDVQLTWFPRWCELFPELMRFTRLPPGVQLVHANSGHAFAFLGRGVPLVATVHHLVYDKAYAPYRSISQALYHNLHLRWREEQVVRRADAMTAVSSYVARTVAEVFRRDDLEVIPNWVDTNAFRPAQWMPASGQKLRLLLVGNPSRRKGWDLVPKLAGALGDEYEIRCTGGLRGDSAKLHAGSGLVWLGRLSVPDLIAEYQACDVAISLSRYEGFGYTALEAMACGKPVVAFAAGGIVDVVEDGGSGFLIPNGDLAMFASKVMQLGAAPSLRKAMGDRGRAFAEGLASAADRYVALYRRVLAKGR